MSILIDKGGFPRLPMVPVGFLPGKAYPLRLRRASSAAAPKPMPLPRLPNPSSAPASLYPRLRRASLPGLVELASRAWAGWPCPRLRRALRHAFQGAFLGTSRRASSSMPIPYGTCDPRTTPNQPCGLTLGVGNATTVESVTVIATESLSMRFPRVTALDQLTVEISPGVTGLVGANGAGKSTLIKILLGLAAASEGRAAVLGLDVATDGAAIRERVGYMPEHDCLPPDVSATEFVVHMARMSGLPPTAARERTADTLRHVGLYEERYRPIGGYSTGMKQRVKLAQALVHDPELVFLDEPTNGLDPVGRDDMLALIRRVHTDFGISVLVTSHLLGELERTCDHVVVIDGGTLLRSSSTSDFTQATGSLAVEVTDTETHPDATAALRNALVSAGLAVQPAGRAGGADQAAGGAYGAGEASGSERLLFVDVAGDDTYDVVRDAIAHLGLGLVRMEQRRHRIAELFRPEGESDEDPYGNPDAAPDAYPGTDRGHDQHHRHHDHDRHAGQTTKGATDAA
jgi:ABC-2 type transport system ATP-binding protein